MRHFEKLENPQLIELEGENSFIIATEMDLSNVNNKVIIFKGKYYNYDDGELTGDKLAEVQYSLTEDAYYQLDKDGKLELDED